MQIKNPILTGTDMMKIKALKQPHLRCAVISMLSPHSPTNGSVATLSISTVISSV